MTGRLSQYNCRPEWLCYSRSRPERRGWGLPDYTSSYTSAPHCNCPPPPEPLPAYRIPHWRAHRSRQPPPVAHRLYVRYTESRAYNNCRISSNDNQLSRIRWCKIPADRFDRRYRDETVSGRSPARGTLQRERSGCRRGKAAFSGSGIYLDTGTGPLAYPYVPPDC